MLTAVMLRCAVGRDVSFNQIEYWEAGKRSQVHLSYALRNSFERALLRMSEPHLSMWPQLADTYLTPSERDLEKNFKSIRNFVLSLWRERKAGSHKNSDLIDVMLQDPTFRADDDSAVDEILTIIFAGSQTSANVTQNLILQLCKHPKFQSRIVTDDDFS